MLDFSAICSVTELLGEDTSKISAGDLQCALGLVKEALNHAEYSYPMVEFPVARQVRRSLSTATKLYGFRREIRTITVQLGLVSEVYPRL